MLKHLLIAGTSLRVSEMTLGTMNWGASVPADRALQLYDIYRAAGGNTLDTAHLYACWDKTPTGENALGASEKVIGDLLRQRPDRRQLIIISKGGHPVVEPNYPRPDGYLAPQVVRKDLSESLSRMGIPFIDLYFLHRDDRRVPVADIIEMMNQLVSEGMIRYFGASNWSAARIIEANAYAAKKGVMGFVASQPEFSLAVPTTGTPAGAAEPPDDHATRFMSVADLRWHHVSHFPAFCYSPTARGYFATGGTKAAKAFSHPETHARLARAQELATKKSVTANQIALAWLRAQPFPAIPIVGPSSAEHLNDALASARVQLTADELKWLTG